MNANIESFFIFGLVDFSFVRGGGAGATGGAKDFIVNGTMTGGFAVVAYPRGVPKFRNHDVHRC
jgi:hypothetical protein